MIKAQTLEDGCRVVEGKCEDGCRNISDRLASRKWKTGVHSKWKAGIRFKKAGVRSRSTVQCRWKVGVWCREVGVLYSTVQVEG
jgi:hypothetical protein